MSSHLGSAKPFARAVVDEIRTENVTFMAGSIAYQAFLSLLPLLILVFFVVSAVGDQQLATQVETQTNAFLPESAQTLLGNAIAGNAGSTGVSVIGIVTLLWGSLKIFRGLDMAFSEIYDSEAKNSFLDQVTDGLVVLVTIGVAILAAGAATTIFAVFEDVPFIGLLSPLALVVALTIAFVPMYYFFPDIDVSVREVLPGVLVAAVGWTALQALFQIYVSFSSKTDAYGILGAIIILLTWLYFSGLILLLGAVVNAVLAGRTGDRAPGSGGTAVNAAADGKASDDVATTIGERWNEGERRATGGNEGTRADFARYLRDVGSGFSGTGTAMVRVGSEDVALHPPTAGIRYDVAVVDGANGDGTDGSEKGNGSEGSEEGFVLEARWCSTGEWSSATVGREAHSGSR